MSETMSSPISDWVQLYQRNLSGQAQTKPAATDTTTTRSTSASSGLIPEAGRVSKPVRKRSRASRRTPTTLLNTDTANFRAMVQQFTGGPASTPFASGSHYPSRANVNFGLGTSQQIVNPNAVMVPRAGEGINFVQLQQFQEQQYMVSMNNSTTSHCSQLGFLQSSRGGVLGVTGGMEGTHVSSSVRSSSFNNPINRDNYML